MKQVAQLVKNLPANGGDTRHTSSIPGLGRSPEIGNGKPLQCSCLENSMDRGAWQAIDHGVAKSMPACGHLLLLYLSPLGAQTSLWFDLLQKERPTREEIKTTIYHIWTQLSHFQKFVLLPQKEP